MIDSTTYEAIKAILFFIFGSGSIIGGRYWWNRHGDKIGGNGQGEIITKKMFKESREACREEVLGKLKTIDTTLRGDGRPLGDTGLIAMTQHQGKMIQSIDDTLKDVCKKIDAIRTHQKNGGTK